MKNLLARQIKAATRDGDLNIEQFLQSVLTTYEEFERDAERVERGNDLMAEELEASHLALKQSMAELSSQSQRLKAVLDYVPHGICLYDDEGRIVEYNARFPERYGVPNDRDLHGQSLPTALSDAANTDKHGALQRLLLVEHAVLPATKHSSVEQVWKQDLVLRVTRDPVDGGGYIDTVMDVTEEHVSRQHIQRLATHDSLTDLPNRTLCQDLLADAIHGVKQNALAAILCLDLDRFKAVNDSFGHAIGDALLIEVSKRLRGLLRSCDTAVRLGGDEFAVILRCLQRPEDAERTAKRIISRLSEPYQIEGHQICIGTSIGIEVITEADAADSDTLLRDADLALYAAKARGRNAFSLFRPEMCNQADRRRELEHELRYAVDRREFVVYYQPLFNLATQSMRGVEALARWRSPSRGLLLPSDFIPLAEEIGVIDRIGAQILEMACRDACNLPGDLTVTVNLSAAQVRSDHLLPLISRVLAETGLRPDRLELEIAKPLMISASETTLDLLYDLKALGCRLSLSDFGTVFMRHLRSYPFDKIKIGNVFVRDLGLKSDSLGMIRMLTTMCRSMGIEFVAQGVETEEQLAVLKSESCDTVQGFLFSAPVPFKDIQSSILADRRAVAARDVLSKPHDDCNYLSVAPTLQPEPEPTHEELLSAPPQSEIFTG